MNFPKKEHGCLADSLRDFLKTFDVAAKCLQIRLPRHNPEIGSKKSKNNLSTHYYKEIIERSLKQVRPTFRFEYNKF